MKKYALVAFLFIGCNQNQTENTNKPQSEVSTNKYISSERQPLLVNINALILKSPREVSKFLGKPNKVIKNSKDSPNSVVNPTEMHYDKDSITVFYTKYDIAYWFEFDNVRNYSITNLPEIFGLSNRVPTTTGDGYIWFQSVYPYIKNVSFTPQKSNPSKLEWAIVEVDEKDLPMNSFR